MGRGWFYRIANDQGNFARIQEVTFVAICVRSRATKEYEFHSGVFPKVSREGPLVLIINFVQGTGNKEQFLNYVYV